MSGADAASVEVALVWAEDVLEALSVDVDPVAVDSVAEDVVSDSVVADELSDVAVSELDAPELVSAELVSAELDTSSDELDAIVPSVVGSLKAVGVAVSGALKLVISTLSFPLADPCTLVPISDAEPHPY